MTKNTADITELETPCLLLDRTKLRRNIARMQTKLSAFNVDLRPHLKTAKNIDVAQLATAGQSAGITVSTLKEAEYFFERGIDNILYAVGIAPNKIAHVAALQAKGANITVVLDNMAAARALDQPQVLNQQSIPLRTPLPVLIEIDSDGHRSGIVPSDPALIELGRFIHRSENMVLHGVMTHAGSSYECDSVRAIRAVARQEHEAIIQCAVALISAGLPCPVVSLGSTPTALFVENLDGVTEVRAGVYMFFDLVMAGLEVCGVDDIALSVLCSVIGQQQEKNRLITDAGWMAMSRDRGTAKQKIDQGYGLVCDVWGRPLADDLIVSSANQEHGIVSRRDAGQIDFDAHPVGSLLRILPNHACATGAQHSQYHIVEGDTEIKGVWKRFSGW